MSDDRLGALSEWADRLAAPDFDFGHWVKSEQRADGVFTLGYYEFSPQALEFLRACPIEVFEWPEWARTDEAQRLYRDRAVLAQATPEQLVKLLTGLIRSDRFSEGTLAEAFESGLLAAIARRARELSDGSPRAHGGS